jgi:hypothetical protein
VKQRLAGFALINTRSRRNSVSAVLGSPSG